MSIFKKASARLALLFAIVLVIALATVGCSQQSPAPTPSPSTTPELSGEITTAGSTTVQPVSEMLAEAFKAKYPKVNVVVQGGGSSVGVKSAAEGTVDIGAASRELKEEEKQMGITEFVIAKDGIAIVVHPAQMVKGLTKAQVQDIFAGKITKWSEVGGANKSIHIVAREEGSGTRAAFEEMVMSKDALIAKEAILQPSNGAVRTTVAGDPDSIGFLSMGYLDNSVKALDIDGTAATVENAKSGVYPIVRPLLYLTKGQPSGLVKAYIDFVLSSEGQTIVSKDYLPVK
jgi:phosphate transport system substrate-binding protein